MEFAYSTGRAVKGGRRGGGTGRGGGGGREGGRGEGEGVEEGGVYSSDYTANLTFVSDTQQPQL